MSGEQIFQIALAIVAVAMTAVWFQSPHTSRVIGSIFSGFSGSINAAQRI